MMMMMENWFHILVPVEARLDTLRILQREFVFAASRKTDWQCVRRISESTLCDIATSNGNHNTYITKPLRDKMSIARARTVRTYIDRILLW